MKGASCSANGCDFNQTGECANPKECERPLLEAEKRKQLEEIASNIPKMLTIQNQMLGGLKVTVVALGIFGTLCSAVLGAVTYKLYKVEDTILALDKEKDEEILEIRKEISKQQLENAKQLGSLTSNVERHVLETNYRLKGIEEPQGYNQYPPIPPKGRDKDEEIAYGGQS